MRVPMIYRRTRSRAPLPPPSISRGMRLKMPAPDWRTRIVWKARRPRSTCFIPGVSIQKRRLNWRAAPNRPRSMQARGFAIRKAQPSAHSTASLYSRPVTVFWPVIHIRAIAFHALRLRSTASICSATELAMPEAVGRYAAERALARLQPRALSARACPVLFEAPLAAGLLGAFVRAVSGVALYRRASFLVDRLGERIFAPHIQIHEAPHQPRAMGAAPFDQEGVRTRARDVVRDGIVQGYFLSTYSARKLGMQTTGNAGGAHQLALRSAHTRDKDDLRAMLKKLDTGLLLTEVMGQGVNYVTGDYSRGAVGFWVERGEIQYPVEGITVAGNLKQMFKDIVAVGADVYANSAKETGSVLIEKMTVAG